MLSRDQIFFIGSTESTEYTDHILYTSYLLDFRIFEENAGALK